ncbi:MAG: hypothetical protein FD167_894 [bacterium]|nr:MAG: hypothetical protein FD167_894 [bacterium]
MSNSFLDKAGKRRKSLMPANKICLSYCYSETSTARRQLQVLCQKQFLKTDDNCPEYQDSGTKELLKGIKEKIKKKIKEKIQQTQEQYRKRFNKIHTGCINYVQNCCTTLFLNCTPFYPEDVIYYMLCDKVVPKALKGLKPCMFFNRPWDIENSIDDLLILYGCRL